MPETIDVGGMAMTFLLDRADTGSAASAFRVVMTGDSIVPPPHSHEAFDETVYCEAGKVTFAVDGRPVPLGAGDALFIPRGSVHGFHPDPATGATLVCVATPGSDYFHEVMELFRDAGDGGPDREAIFEVMRRNGVRPAIPAGAA
jgi:quercetin dioxygenase-like cupin family protein